LLHLVVSWILAAVLAAAAVAKLADPADSRPALATFGVRSARAQWALWGAVIALELALAAGVAAGLDAAAWGAAALLGVFAGGLGWALARGRAGAPCACFGARSRVSGIALARDVVLAAAFAALPLLPRGDVATDTWLAAGLVLALLALAALGVAVLALAREVGMLRLAVGSQGALEIPEEGPPLGERTPLSDRFAVTPQTRLSLAVFSSEGCALCHAVAPSVEMLAHEAWLAVEVFDEHRHADAWAAARVPGSPYAVALDPLTGVALAKGTFNGLAQLESVLAAAERRALEAAHA
jgi:hypothetical protein